MTDDLERARREAAELLGLDPDKLTPGDRLRCELISALRAAVDDELGKVTAAGSADLGKLIVAVETLTKLLADAKPKGDERHAVFAKDPYAVTLWLVGLRLTHRIAARGAYRRGSTTRKRCKRALTSWSARMLASAVSLSRMCDNFRRSRQMAHPSRRPMAMSSGRSSSPTDSSTAAIRVQVRTVTRPRQSPSSTLSRKAHGPVRKMGRRRGCARRHRSRSESRSRS